MSEYTDYVAEQEAEQKRFEKQLEEEGRQAQAQAQQAKEEHRKPLTRVPTIQGLPPVYQRQSQQQQQPQEEKQEYDPEIWGTEQPQPQPQQQPQSRPKPPQPQQKYEPKYYGDYDESRELRAKRLPNIYSRQSKQEQIEIMYGRGAAESEEQIVEQYGPIKYRPGLKPVVSTPNFGISDMHIYDSSGKDIIGTFATIVIKPHAQVAPLIVESLDPDPAKQKRVIYEIMSGQGLVCIKNFTEHIMAGDIFFVESDVEHNFFNTTNELLIYRLFYDGYLDLRDRYFPSERAKEVAKESRREVFNAQQQRNVPVGSHQPQYNIGRRTEEKFA